MLATIWDGPIARLKDGKRRVRATWSSEDMYSRAYRLDDDIDAEEELPDNVSELSEEPEAPLRRHIVMRHAAYSS